MEESCKTLQSLGIEPVMTSGTVRRQREQAGKTIAFKPERTEVANDHDHRLPRPLHRAAQGARRMARKQKAAFKAGTECPPYPEISDDEIRETIEGNQLRLLKERGADMTIFSPALRPWRRTWATSRSR
jgi:hypothetical protein